jgi:hypothetical protein
MSCPECVGVDTARRPMHLRVSPVQASVGGKTEASYRLFSGDRALTWWSRPGAARSDRFLKELT